VLCSGFRTAEIPRSVTYNEILSKNDDADAQGEDILFWSLFGRLHSLLSCLIRNVGMDLNKSCGCVNVCVFSDGFFWTDFCFFVLVGPSPVFSSVLSAVLVSMELYSCVTVCLSMELYSGVTVCLSMELYSGVTVCLSMDLYSGVTVCVLFRGFLGLGSRWPM
jgi:hypothetical protein